MCNDEKLNSSRDLLSSAASNKDVECVAQVAIVEAQDWICSQCGTVNLDFGDDCLDCGMPRLDNRDLTDRLDDSKKGKIDERK